MGEGLPAPSPHVSHFFSFFPHICLKKFFFFLNKLNEGELPMGWKGWARPPSRPEAGPRSSPGLCWWPRGALRAGRRAGHPASSRRAGGGQREGVVGLCQLLRAVLLQHHHALEARAAAPGTSLAVHQIRVAAAVLTRHE